jgi:hypothetical protein
VALAIVTWAKAPVRREPGMAERAGAGLLTFSALFVMFNEGIANWQALWFGGLLVLLALTALRAAPAPAPG